MDRIKTVKFMFRDSDKNDLIGFDFIISEGTTWLEMFSNDIKEMFGTYYSDHTLVRLCVALEKELIDGENKYD